MYYDKEDPLDIERYAKQIIGKDFREILRASYVAETDAKLVLNKSKGNLGEIIEEYHFYYKPNSNSAPDFKDANVELKVTPYKRNLNGTFSSKERLVLNIINYLNIIQEKFKSSTLLSKNSTLLLIFYLWEREIYQLDYKIDYAGLYNFPPEDLLIIEQDWNIIVSKIKDGKAHELSESDTTYLSASTKGSTAEKSFREQPNSAIRAKQRAFSLKASYMTVVLNKFINKEITYEPIIKNIMQLENETLEECITKKFKINYGLNINEIEAKYNININKASKSYYYYLAKKILNIEADYIEEIQKANIKIKSIRVENDGKIKEHMSFPAFKYKELAKEQWKTSTLREFFNGTKFLFIVFKENNNGQRELQKILFWNMPISDLETDVRKVWLKTLKKIRRNEFNDFPRATENRILHVRPHASNAQDTYPAPNGEYYTKKCFWLNKNYILSIINE